MLLYPLTVQHDGDGWLVLFPDIPHAHASGDSREDAVAHAPDALQTALGMLMEKGLEIPRPRKLRGKSRPMVGLPSVIADAKVELYIALRDAGMRKTELARRMGIHKQQVERLLDIDHSSRLDQLEPVFAAIGKRLFVLVEEAA